MTRGLFPLICLGFSLIGLAIGRTLERAFALFRPEPLRVVAEGPAIVLRVDGAPFSPALLNAIRHESRARLVSAARAI